MMSGKNILFIAPVFYDYQNLIIDKIRKNKDEVVFFPEKNDGFLFKFLNTLNPKFIDFYQKIYFWFIIKKVKKIKISHFFLIRGYKMPVFFLEFLRKNNPNIIMTMYQWDSNKNNPYYHIVDYFDNSYTFDQDDFNENDKLKFLQLFYTDDIKRIGNSKKELKYDFFCFFSYTDDRYESLIKLIKHCDLHKFSLFSFCYIPYSTFIRLKYVRGIKLDKNIISFKPMSRVDYIKYLEISKTVIDFSHYTQSGLSMKVIESLGANKKILTSNKSIFYNPVFSSNQVAILDLDNLKVNDFDFAEKNTTVSDLYIDNWLSIIFDSK